MPNTKNASGVSRRTILRGMGGLAALPAFSLLQSPAIAAPLAELALYGPPAGPSITLAHAAATGMFSALADKAQFTVWRNPDELRAGLTSGNMSVVVMPVQAAANMYNRGMGIRLVNTLTNGLLYIISADPGLTSFEALKGKSLAVPFRNDTPDLVLNRLLRFNTIATEGDIRIETTGTPIEALQLLLSGRIDAALVPEPAATAAIIRGASAGKTIHRVIDIQKAWSDVTGLGPVLPQAGLAVSDAFRSEHPELVAALHNALIAATAATLADPLAAANNAAAALDMPTAILEKSIPFSNLAAVKAAEARPAIEIMLTTLADTDPAIIGGKLPDDGFYL